MSHFTYLTAQKCEYFSGYNIWLTLIKLYTPQISQILGSVFLIDKTIQNNL